MDRIARQIAKAERKQKWAADKCDISEALEWKGYQSALVKLRRWLNHESR